MRKVGNAFGMCLLLITLLGAACVSLEQDDGSLAPLPAASATSSVLEAGDSEDDPLTSPQPAPARGEEGESVEPAAPTGDPERMGAEPDEPGLTSTVERGTERLPERVPSPEHPTITGEVPQEILDAILADLAMQTGADRAAIETLRAEAVVWNDGSLGCPKPGQFYTQALVPGYWVVLRVGSQDYDYRASNTGHFMRCESSRPLISPPGDSGGGPPPDQ